MNDWRMAPLERLPGESQRAHSALIQYWKLGNDRSLSKLRDALIQLGTENATVSPSALGTLKRWSQQNHWVERVRQADASNSQMAIEAHRSDYISGIENLRQTSELFGKDIFSECRSHLKLLKQQRESIESKSDIRASELAALARTLFSLAQVAEAAIAVQCRALGIDRVIEQLFEHS